MPVDINTEDRAGLTKTLHDMKTALEASQADRDAMARDLRDSLQRVQQAQAELRARESAQLASDPTTSRYMGDDAEYKAGRRCYAANKGVGAVRLYGHEVDGRGYLPGYLDDKPATEHQREAQRLATQRGLVRACLGKGASSPISDHQLLRHMQRAPGAIGKIFTDSSTLGQEWLAVTQLPELEREVRNMVGLSDLFTQREMVGKSVKLPFSAGKLRVYKKAIPAANDPSNATLSDYSTDENEITPVSAVVSTQLDRDAAEDSIIAAIPTLTEEIARAVKWGDSDCIMNGDTAGTQDALGTWDPRGELGGALVAGALDHRRRWDGLRRKAFIKSTAVDATADADIGGVCKAWLGAGVRHMMDVVHITSPEYFISTLVKLPEVLTWDATGPMASILTGMIGQAGPLPGQVGFLFGRPLIVDASMTADMNALGVYDNVTTTRTGMVTVARSRYELWTRKGMTVEQDVEPRNDTVTLVARYRNVFREKDASTHANVYYSFDLPAS